jgi:hypothetical protein
MRANALKLCNAALFRYTPSLLVIATISWAILVATIYLPGAVTVGLESRQVQEQFDVSVILPSGELNYTERYLPTLDDELPSVGGIHNSNGYYPSRWCIDYS